MSTVAEDFRRALQDVVAPDLKIIAQDIKELKDIVKSQGTGFYAALHGLNQKIDDVRQDVQEVKTEVRKLGSK
jgi:hypothetical protein